MAHINLLPWRETRRREQQREFVSVTVFSVVLTAIVVVYVHLHINGQIAYQDRRNQYLDNEIKILDNKIKDIKQLESTKQALLDRMRVIETLQANRPKIVHLFDQLARTLPDGTYLTSVKQANDKLTLTGRAESNARVSAYMRNIEGSDWLAKPSLDVIATRENKVTRISDFTLQAEQSSPPNENSADAAKQGK